MKANQAQFPIATMCRVLAVSTSGYYQWRNRQRSKRDQDDAMLTEKIRTIHRRSRGTYGTPRIHAELRDEGVFVARKRVARLMQSAHLQGVSRRKGVITTIRSGRDRPAPDLVERDFTAEAPNQLWVADITYIATGGGFLYLSVVLDAFSRRIVGWSMASHLRSALVLAALKMALDQRKPKGVIHHSDQGSQLSDSTGRRNTSHGGCCHGYT